MAAWTHSDVGLGDIVKHAAAFLDILIVASGVQSDGSPALWSRVALQKALGWASYFEQVLGKLPTGKEGEASKLALDLALDALLAAVPLPPGCSGLSFSVLASARSLLVQVLVQALPIENACLVADFLESDENGNGDLWEVVIKALSDRCLAFGSVKCLQQVLDASAGPVNSKAITVPRVEIWKSSESSLAFKASSSERWAKEGLKYVLSVKTVHKLSGATLIFRGNHDDWTQVFDSLQRRTDSGRHVMAEIAEELCCLFLASSRWKELPRQLLHSACKSFGKLSTESYTDWWVDKNLADIPSSKEDILPEVREDVEGYLQKLLDSANVWWSLAPILLAVVFADSAALQFYVDLIGKRVDDAPTGLCSSDCSCKMCWQRSDAQERAWCLLLLLGGHRGSHLTKKLHGILRFPATLQ